MFSKATAAHDEHPTIIIAHLKLRWVNKAIDIINFIKHFRGHLELIVKYNVDL